jgi:hypothetical protein
MVAITTLTGYPLHTGGSAAHPSPAPAAKETAAETPATIVTLSDRAQQLVAEAKAAQAVGDIFALANGVATRGQGAAAKTQAVIAHDLKTNEGLYILWSSVR